MKSLLQPWRFLLLIRAGWINSRQQGAIDYLLTENRVLREKLGKNRILLNATNAGGSQSKARSSVARCSTSLPPS
jgi:hypothetical protein